MNAKKTREGGDDSTLGGYGGLDVVIPITTTSDLVVNEVANLTKQEAKEEMKAKGATTEFTLPECLPAIPATVREQEKKLVLKKFRER